MLSTFRFDLFLFNYDKKSVYDKLPKTTKLHCRLQSLRNFGVWNSFNTSILNLSICLRVSAFFHLARWLQSTAADLQFALLHFVLVSIPWSMLLVQFTSNFRIFPAVPPDQMLKVMEGATSTLKSFHHQILTLQKHNVHGDAAFPPTVGFHNTLPLGLSCQPCLFSQDFGR